MREGLVVGIDGGGSKTLIAAADGDGQVTVLVRGSAISPLESGDWGNVLAEQLRPFLEKPDVRAVAAALPAYGEVATISAAQNSVVAGLCGSIPHCVLNDVDAANIGAFAGCAGILILAGTGSMAWARNAGGISFRTGGWGAVIGDEGSGYWIGKRILEAVSQSIDGRAGRTGLVEAVFAQLHLDTTDQVGGLEGWAATLVNPRSQIAALAPLATTFAENGDAAARTIIDSAAEQLARHVRTLELKLDDPSLAWSYAGGMFSSPVMREAVADRVGRPPRQPRLPPIGGSLLAAARHIGWQPDEGWIERLARSIQPLLTQDEHMPNKEKGLCEDSS